MSAPNRGKPSLIAAAQGQPQPQTQTQPQASSSTPTNPPNLASIPMSTVSSSTSGSGSISARSTPAPSAGGVQRLKFKPKVPIRRVKQEVDVKPDVSSIPSASTAPRGGMRGAPRGRGGAGRGRGRGAAPVPSTSIAAGVFGGPRPVPSASTNRKFTSTATTSRFDEQDAEVYSDHSDTEGVSKGRPIDIDLVSTMSESAPTSLYRDRRSNQDKKVKGKEEKDKKKERKKNKESQASTSTSTPMEVDNVGARLGVKAEPISPEKQTQQLREDDTMLSDDEMQDRDTAGRRVRNFAQTGGSEQPTLQSDEDGEEEVNEAQMVDLSESEEEEEEEDMMGDFNAVDGYDNPEEKLFIFQFPHLFPKFLPSTPVDLTTDTKPDINGAAAAPKDVKPDIKPTPAQLRGTGPGGKKGVEPLPEGRVGTMVVMKSGRVKIVMGKDIVMNVTPGLPTTFIQHLVHLDNKTKSAHVLGEVHKNYVVTPDIDRLLEDLYINGGQTPGEVDAERRRRLIREKGLIPMKKERD